jgi:UDP-GlcNAc3NAcA epimerase
MKILSVIGTRPQYIKFKPLHDQINKLSQFDHFTIDSKQHYSNDVSESLIKDLELSIDRSLENTGMGEIDFITSTIKDIEKIIVDIKPTAVVVMGDTNTTFCAALAANKCDIPIAHIESGERSLTKKPEEINRQYTDLVSSVHFCSARRHMKNVDNPIYTGDLEYELLNYYNPNINHENFGLLTLHRQENMKEEKIEKYFNLIKKLDCDVIFPVHHRTRIFLNNSKIVIPDNVKIENPMKYTSVVTAMSKCRFIMTDSGGIQKTSPFFGKKCLIMREAGEEWKETYESGYCMRISEDNEIALDWLVSKKELIRDKYFYCDQNIKPSEIILKNLVNL